MVLFRPEMTGREIARQCGISHMMAYRALNIFESQGIVKKSRIGRSSLYRINEDNILINSLIKPLFANEESLLKNLLKGLFERVKKHVVSIILFGSTVKGTERTDSDVDVFILVREKKEKDLVEKILPDIGSEFIKQTGNLLSPMVLTKTELNTKLYSNKILLTKIKEGETLIGVPIKEIIYDR
jgi:predicted nucleotidyltransferase